MHSPGGELSGHSRLVHQQDQYLNFSRVPTVETGYEPLPTPAIRSAPSFQDYGVVADGGVEAMGVHERSGEALRTKAPL